MFYVCTKCEYEYKPHYNDVEYIVNVFQQEADEYGNKRYDDLYAHGGKGYTFVWIAYSEK